MLYDFCCIAYVVWYFPVTLAAVLSRRIDTLYAALAAQKSSKIRMKFETELKKKSYKNISVECESLSK